MGVYIKNMEIRENCMNCAARHGAECWLADCSYIPNYRKERPKWCPLVPVPEHGRLIDKDALEADISASVVFSGREGNAEIIGAKKIINRLHVAPTIISAEEGE